MKKVKISLIINCIIVILVTFGCIFMYMGLKFMPGESLLEVSKMEMFKFFTIDSNILVGISSLLMIIYENKLLKSKIDKIPNNIYILKQIGTSAVTLTFLTTLLFLTPQYGFYSMYSNNNLFFHLIVPILSIISYILFEKHSNRKKYALYGIIPMAIYSVYYIANILIHLNDGGLTTKYDFYGFLQGNINNVYIVIPLMYFITYIISLSLTTLNIKINDNKN